MTTPTPLLPEPQPRPVPQRPLPPKRVRRTPDAALQYPAPEIVFLSGPHHAMTAILSMLLSLHA